VFIADPTFDLPSPMKGNHLAPVSTGAAESTVCKTLNGQRNEVCNADVSCWRQSTKKWSSDVDLLVSSEQWLKIYGLKSAKLDMNTLLRQIGFRHSDGKHDSCCDLVHCSTVLLFS